MPLKMAVINDYKNMKVANPYNSVTSSNTIS